MWVEWFIGMYVVCGRYNKVVTYTFHVNTNSLWPHYVPREPIFTTLESSTRSSSNNPQTLNTVHASA